MPEPSIVAPFEMYHYDKSGWPEGPWRHEPDKCGWRDEATGLPCLIVRNRAGGLCGYVGVWPGHPWHGKDATMRFDGSPPADGEDNYEATIDGTLDSHGGITFAGWSQPGDPEQYVNWPELEDAIDGPIWWFGFDCAHAWDYLPKMDAEMGDLGGAGDVWRGPDLIYRDRTYVAAICARLARQIVTAERYLAREAARDTSKLFVDEYP